MKICENCRDTGILDFNCHKRSCKYFSSDQFLRYRQPESPPIQNMYTHWLSMFEKVLGQRTPPVPVKGAPFPVEWSIEWNNGSEKLRVDYTLPREKAHIFTAVPKAAFLKKETLVGVLSIIVHSIWNDTGSSFYLDTLHFATGQYKSRCENGIDCLAPDEEAGARGAIVACPLPSFRTKYGKTFIRLSEIMTGKQLCKACLLEVIKTRRVTNPGDLEFLEFLKKQEGKNE